MNLCGICDTGRVRKVQGHKPFSDGYWQCDHCDSTFPDDTKSDRHIYLTECSQGHDNPDFCECDPIVEFNETGRTIYHRELVNR